MTRILIVRPSSLGDIVHAMPVVHDLHANLRAAVVDWVAEESFAPLVRLQPGVRRVIVVALRRWRQRLLAGRTWREAEAFRRELRVHAYDVVLDFQEQVKGAAIAWLARGPVHGPDRASIREPAAVMLYRHVYRIDPRQHLVDRCRALAGKALGYVPTTLAHAGLVVPQDGMAPLPASRYVVFVHATSRDDKLWPEAAWRSLIAHFTRAGYEVVLPWGSPQEAARSERLALGGGGVHIPARMELPQLATLLSKAELVCGVDTGLVHLAAALGAPTIALFVSTDPALAGVARIGAHARDLGAAGRPPGVDEVVATAGALLRLGPGC